MFTADDKWADQFAQFQIDEEPVRDRRIQTLGFSEVAWICQERCRVDENVRRCRTGSSPLSIAKDEKSVVLAQEKSHNARMLAVAECTDNRFVAWCVLMCFPREAKKTWDACRDARKFELTCGALFEKKRLRLYASMWVIQSVIETQTIGYLPFTRSLEIIFRRLSDTLFPRASSVKFGVLPI